MRKCRSRFVLDKMAQVNVGYGNPTYDGRNRTGGMRPFKNDAFRLSFGLTPFGPQPSPTPEWLSNPHPAC